MNHAQLRLDFTSLSSMAPALVHCQVGDPGGVLRALGGSGPWAALLSSTTSHMPAPGRCCPLHAPAHPVPECPRLHRAPPCRAPGMVGFAPSTLAGAGLARTWLRRVMAHGEGRTQLPAWAGHTAHHHDKGHHQVTGLRCLSVSLALSSTKPGGTDPVHAWGSPVVVAGRGFSHATQPASPGGSGQEGAGPTQAACPQRRGQGAARPRGLNPASADTAPLPEQTEGRGGEHGSALPAKINSPSVSPWLRLMACDRAS